jgi:hypothetical protein
MGHTKTKRNPRVDAAFLQRGMGLGMGSFFSEQLEVFGGAGIPEQSQRFGGGAFLLFRIGRPDQAKALSGVAGNQHRSGKGWKWRES